MERLREAVYGTIVMLSVLAVLSERDPSAALAALSVLGTSLVLFFAQVYAGSVAERIRGDYRAWTACAGSRPTAGRWPR